MNITKFGAFVNILPGRDGLVHISKLGRGKRIERVEDVLDLGDEIMVRVDDIDPNGKVSLTPIGEGDEGTRRATATASRRARPPSVRPASSSARSAAPAARQRCRSRIRSTPRPASSSATSVPRRRLPRRASAHAATTAVATVVAGRGAAAAAEAAAVAERSRIETHRAGFGCSRHHGADARGPTRRASACGSASALATSPRR